MPLPRSFASLKREISEKKWAEARQWDGGRTARWLGAPRGLPRGSTRSRRGTAFTEVEEPVEDPGPPGIRAVQSGGAGLPFTTVVGRRVDAGSKASEWELRERWEREEEREAEAEELGAEGEWGAGEEPLSLPAPPFIASAGDEE